MISLPRAIGFAVACVSVWTAWTPTAARSDPGAPGDTVLLAQNPPPRPPGGAWEYPFQSGPSES